MDSKIEVLIEETIKDLKLKGAGIEKASEGFTGEIGEKITAIKDRAIKILDDVADKVAGISDNTKTDEEALEVISTIKVKSEKLYENAIGKINELKRGTYQNFINTPEEAAPTVTQNQIVEETIRVNTDASDIGDRIMEVLHSWLQPEGDS